MPKIHVQTRINGEDIDFLCETRQSLLEVLRDELGLTGHQRGLQQRQLRCVQCVVGWRPGGLLSGPGGGDGWERGLDN